MTPQKRWFLILSALFILLMLYLSYDIMSRTTRPGQRKHLPESLKQ